MPRKVKVSRKDRLESPLRKRIWPQLPANLRGRHISKKKREKILGYGPSGV
jgi:hypothetical protein